MSGLRHTGTLSENVKPSSTDPVTVGSWIVASLDRAPARSSRRSRSGSAIPGPSSDTAMRTLCSPSLAARTVIVVFNGAYLLALSSRI